MKQLLITLVIVILHSTSYSQQTDHLTIYFDFNKSELTNSSVQKIDSLITANKNTFKIIQIELSGHCDIIGSFPYNDKLSERRVETTKKYLLSKGIDNSLAIHTNGFGKNQLVNKNLTAEERALNRRVELIIQKEALAINTNKEEKPVATKESEKISLAKQLGDSSIKAGSRIILKNLNFQGARHFLVEKSLPVLNELLQLVKDNPTLVIEIQGHICCTFAPDGLDEDMKTYDLSVQRAKYIYEYLIKNGIDARRLSYKGYGSSQKLYPEERNTFEEEQNRRVEIKIISK
jgi:outer membrane protein OmpA-like peptidoglycan-associated protein